MILREEDIMTEIITNGPVQATFIVHEDFFSYVSGKIMKCRQFYEGFFRSLPILTSSRV